MAIGFNLSLITNKIEELENKISDIEVNSSKDYDKYNMFVLDHNTLLGFLIQVVPNCGFSYVEHTTDFEQLIKNYKKVNNTQLLFSPNIRKALGKFLSMDIPLNLEKIEKKYTNEESIDFAMEGLDSFDTQKILKELVDNKNLCLLNNKIVFENVCKAISGSLITEDINLVYVQTDHNIQDAENIAHEVGHIEQYRKAKTLDEYVNITSSSLIETNSILKEMIFFDRMEELEDKKDVLVAQGIFLNKMYSYAYELLVESVNTHSRYIFSFILACYLYQLYNIDKKKYAYACDKLNKGILKNNDVFTIKTLGIEQSYLEKAVEFYVNSYVRKISKGKRKKFKI